MTKPHQYRMEFKSEIHNLGTVAAFIGRTAEECGLDERQTYNVQMAVDEAVTNVIQHAYHGTVEGRIELRCEMKDGDFIVEIRDRGKPFDPSSVREPRVHGPISRRSVGGLGVFFMKKLMDRVEFTSDAVSGNCVRMVKRVK